MRTRTTTLAFCLAAVLAAPASAQKPARERLTEAEVIRRMDAANSDDWESAVAWSLAVSPGERSPELLTAMIEALEHSIRWHVGGQQGPVETGGHLAQALAVTRDPRALRALAWYAYNGPPNTVILTEFGHQAVPHMLAVAMSPDAPGDHARAALQVLAGIVVQYGPGEYAPELDEAAMFHLNGPPENYYSRWSNVDSICPLLEAIALAGAIRTPELLERLEAIAGSTPAQIEQLTGSSFHSERAPACARAMLDGTDPPTPLCNPGWWVRPPEQ